MLRIALVILATFLFCLVGGCAHTNTYMVDISNPEFQLSNEDLGALTTEERGAIPMGVTAKYYPDAVVYEVSSFYANPDYERYDRENSQPLPNGGRKLPTFMISSERRTETVGDHVVIMKETSAFCIPGTEKCSRSVSTEVTVLRREPINRKWSGLGWVSEPSGAIYPMLDITLDATSNIVIKLENLSRGIVNTGECRSISTRGTVTWQQHGLLREEIRRRMSRSSDGYVTYHVVREFDDNLTQYQFALNGCYHDDPTEERARLARGKEILAQFASFLK